MDKVLSQYIKDADMDKKININKPSSITILSILQKTGSLSKNGCKYCYCKKCSNKKINFKLL
jgi:hypothetical protein